MFELLGRLSRQLVTEGGERLLTAVEEDDPHRGRFEGAELAPQATARQVPDLPRQFNPRWAGPDDSNGEPTLFFDRVSYHLSHLERTKDPPAQLVGVVERLHSGRVQRELVMAEIGLADPGRHDQAVVGYFEGHDAGNAGVHDPAVKVEPCDLGQLHPDVLVLAQHVAYGRRDLARREHAGRHLV